MRANSKIARATALLAVAAVAGVAAVSSSARSHSTAGAASSSSLTWGITSIDPSLDPGDVYAIDPNIITAAMCNSLLQFNSRGELAPELASSWKQTSPTTFVYNLVHNAKFWDGNPVTAADAAYSIDRIASPKLASPLLSLLQTGNIKDATANGKWQVVVHLTNPNPIAEDLPATPIGQVVEKSFVEKYGLAFGTTPAKTMCSGPFKPVSYVKGARTVLRRRLQTTGTPRTSRRSSRSRSPR